MAVTSGQGNPKWTKDETILALDLYFYFDGKIPDSTHKQILELSTLLRQMPLHPLEIRKDSFRNPDGVAFKLQNIRQVATGKGLDNTSQMDKSVWAEFGTSPELVKELANRIKKGISIIGSHSEVDSDIDDDEAFQEGKIITALHKKRDRAPGIRRKMIKERKKNGALSCDICGTKSNWTPLGSEECIFECHHIVPLSEGEVRNTIISDMSLLCASCHRGIHSFIVKSKIWITPQDIKNKLIQSKKLFVPNE